jgi:NitT/TauT family transport system permease protein
MNLTRIKGSVRPYLAFAALLCVWEAAKRISGWNVAVFPSPLEAARGMWELTCNGTLLKHSVASLYRVTIGFYLAVIFGIPLGILLGWSKTAQTIANPLIQFLRPISPLAWIPLAVLWFGIGDRPAFFLIFLSSFFPLLVSAINAVNHIKTIYFQVAANFNFSKMETVTLVIFPAILPDILPALRISLGVAWLVVVAAEMIAVKSGLGFLILDSRNALRMDYVMDAMIAIGLLGVVLDRVISQLSRIKSVAWGSA